MSVKTFQVEPDYYWLSSKNFFRGVKSIVMQISIVMLLFSDQISGRGKSYQGETASGGRPLAPPPPVEESQDNPSNDFKVLTIFKHPHQCNAYVFS